jgi:glycogen debranching enzyme
MLDWAPMDTPYHGIVTHQNMLAVWALRSTARLLNDSADVAQASTERLNADADRLTDAINTHLWNGEMQAYVDSIHADGTNSPVTSVQTHLMALLADVAPSARLSRVEEVVQNPPDSFVPIGSPFMSFFLFRHLSDKKRYAALVKAIRDGWGAMIEEGSTTCWETFRGFYTDRLTRSYCHAWSAAPAWYLPEVVLGIRRLGPAWREVEVRPHLGDLNWARGSVVTPHGPIYVRCEKTAAGAIDLNVVAPPGVQVRS